MFYIKQYANEILPHFDGRTFVVTFTYRSFVSSLGVIFSISYRNDRIQFLQYRMLAWNKSNPINERLPKAYMHLNYEKFLYFQQFFSINTLALYNASPTRLQKLSSGAYQGSVPPNGITELLLVVPAVFSSDMYTAWSNQAFQ